MMDPQRIINAHMRTLVNWFGCQHSVAATLDAAIDVNYSGGMISRKVNGSMQWHCREIMVLEDAAQKYPVTKYLAQRLPESQDKSEIADCLVDQSGKISKEVGEAVQAILKAQKSERCDDGAQAIAEIREAIDALQQAENRLVKNGAKASEVVNIKQNDRAK